MSRFPILEYNFLIYSHRHLLHLLHTVHTTSKCINSEFMHFFIRVNFVYRVFFTFTFLTSFPFTIWFCYFRFLFHLSTRRHATFKGLSYYNYNYYIITYYYYYIITYYQLTLNVLTGPYFCFFPNVENVIFLKYFYVLEL